MKTSEIKEKYPDVDINTKGGSDTYQEGSVIVERNNVAVIIKHPEEDLYLIAKWKKSDWNGFVTGGIEEGDTEEDTARIEVSEETGYKNIRIVTSTDKVTHGLFFHPVKKENRLAHYNLVIVELADLEREQVSEEEKTIADFVWVPSEKVLSMLTQDDMKILWEYYCTLSK